MEWIIGVLGLSVGSFLNVLIDRLPRGENVLWGRSHCDHCRKPLRWFELIPLFSYLIQSGRCRRCHQSISIQYPLVELVSGVGFVLLYLLFSDSLIRLFAYSLIFSSLLVIFVADLKYQIIPDSMVVTGIVGSLLSLTFAPNFQFLTFNSQLLSGLGAALFFFLLWVLTRGRGLGLGDVKLSFLLGLILGFPGIVIGLYAAFLTGAIVGVILMISRKKTWKSRIAFGPFMVWGAFVSLLWGQAIIRWWRTFL